MYTCFLSSTQKTNVFLSNTKTFENVLHLEDFQTAVFSCGRVKMETLGDADAIFLFRVMNVDGNIKLIFKQEYQTSKENACFSLQGNDNY